MDTQLAPLEERITSKIKDEVASNLSLSGSRGGLAFTNAEQAMEFAKMMAIAQVAVPKHLRGNVGACLAVVIQAIEWRLSPYAVANKSYSVNDRLAYESQLIQAVILQRAPIEGRFTAEYSGAGATRRLKISARLKGSDQVVDYQSPELGKITPQNSPLWKSDPDQQLYYYSGRALCRRHFPDVLLGIYARDELEDEVVGPEHARDVNPRPSLVDKLDRLGASAGEVIDHGTGEVLTREVVPPETKPAKPTKQKATPRKQAQAPRQAPAADPHQEPEAEPSAASAEAAAVDEDIREDEGSPSTVPLTEEEVEAMRGYHKTLTNCLSPKKLGDASGQFLAECGANTDEGTRLYNIVEEIYGWHLERIGGKREISEIDNLVREALT